MAGLRKRSGFTLVELLVAMTISALLLAVLTGIMSKTLQVSTRSADDMAAMSSAAAVMDLMVADLETLAVTRQPYEYLQARVDPNAPFEGIQPMILMMNVTSPQDSATASTPSGSSTPVYADSGEIHAVSYRIAYQDPIVATAGATPSTTGTGTVFGIYRHAGTASDTFQNALSLNDYPASGTTASDLYTNYWLKYWSTTIPVSTDYLAQNIIDFQIAFYAYPLNSSGQIVGPAVILNPAVTGTAGTYYQQLQISGTATLLKGSPVPAPTTPTGAAQWSAVAYAEVSLTVIEDAGANFWHTTSGQGVGTLSPASLKQKYGHTLTRKVILRSP